MATNIRTIAELEWLRIYPQPQTPAHTLHEFIETAKHEYNRIAWVAAMNEKQQAGTWEMPSELTKVDEVIVKDNQADISGLPILRGLPHDKWLAALMNGTCIYTKTTMNDHLLMGDEDMGIGERFYIMGNRLQFTDKVKDGTYTIIFAQDGSDDGHTIEEANAALVRDALRKIYGQPLPVDKTNNLNPNV